MHRLLLLATLLCTAPGMATERSYSIGSFDRIRVDGPFDVRLETGRSPTARIDDARAAERVALSVTGSTLIVRVGLNGWGETPTRGGVPVIRIATPELRSASLAGGGALTITGPMRGQRVELSVTGSGTLSATSIAAERLEATLIGAGTMTLGGRAARSRLVSSGPGRIDATALSSGDLEARLDGTGETRATARTTATVSSAGLGSVTVHGTPACTVRPSAGPVSCGEQAAP